MDTAISAVELHVNKNYLPTFKQIVVFGILMVNISL